LTDICSILLEKFSKDIHVLIEKTREEATEGVEYSFGICQKNNELKKTKSINRSEKGYVRLPRDCEEGFKLIGVFHTHPTYQFHSDMDIYTPLVNKLNFSCIAHLKEVDKVNGGLVEKDAPGVVCIDFSNMDLVDKFTLAVELIDFNRKMLEKGKKLTREERYDLLKQLNDSLSEYGVEVCRIKL